MIRSPLPRAESGLSRIEAAVLLAVLAFLPALFLPAVAKARTEARKAECKGRLERIGAAHRAYALADGNRGYPFVPGGSGADQLIALYRAGTLSGKDCLLFLCPSSGDSNGWDRLANPASADDTGGRQCSYAGRDNARLGPIPKGASPGTLLASDDFEGSPNHSDGANVLRLDGSVLWYDVKATGLDPTASDPANATKRSPTKFRLDSLAN